jgi:hypothetical protein
MYPRPAPLARPTKIAKQFATQRPDTEARGSLCFVLTLVNHRVAKPAQTARHRWRAVVSTIKRTGTASLAGSYAIFS